MLQNKMKLRKVRNDNPIRNSKELQICEDALEAFYTAVDNGQARLAMSILVDIVEVFAEKIEAL